MSTITTIQSTDLITNSRANINDNFSALNTDKIETSVLDTDTTLAADSDSKVATQKAVKAYVDAGGNVNASTAQKGIVEEATQAEVDAGTTSGSTGARLYVNPGALPRGTIKSVTAGATISGATLPVPVYQNKTDNEFYACDANDTAAMKYLGFAIGNGTDGAAVNVQFTGIVSGFTGLSEGEKYYLQDTVGTIGSTIGTYGILVGVAISETEILIQKSTRRQSGELGALGTASGSEAVVLGFRPSVIRIFGSTIRSDDMGSMQGIWTNGTLVGASALCVPNSTSIKTNTVASLQDVSIYMTLTITSVTDTGFTITWTETGAYTATEVIIWEAEGEL